MVRLVKVTLGVVVGLNTLACGIAAFGVTSALFDGRWKAAGLGSVLF